MSSDDVRVEDGRFGYQGRSIGFTSYGDGPRVLVLTHGLLMDRRMYGRLAPAIARRAFRVITIDLLGHGESDQPYDMTIYSMTEFGRQVVAALDHLDIQQAVIGGTSLGANVSLEVAVAAPERVRALVLEMPVLENGLAAAAGVFVPLALALRLTQPVMRLLRALAVRIPRTTLLADTVLDFVRRDPRSSLAVLDGVTFGRVAPEVTQRRGIRQPVLLIGHGRDPIHPFSDADVLARELSDGRLVEAHSILEWRLFPRRLDDELSAFLTAVWRPREVAASA